MRVLSKADRACNRTTFYKTIKAHPSFKMVEIVGALSIAGALNPVEELPPHFERPLDRGPHLGALHLAHRGVTQNVVAHVAMIAVGDLMHVEKRDLLARKSVIFFQRARERREVPRHLPLCSKIDRADSLRERSILGRELEPVDQRRRRRKRFPMDHILAAQAQPQSEPDEQFRMRRAAGNHPGLFFIEALRQLHPLLGIEASRMQCAERSRKLPHLQKELCREVAHPGLRYFPVGDSMPNRMAPERPPLFHHRKYLAHESVTHRSHLETSGYRVQGATRLLVDLPQIRQHLLR